jgi:DNA-3-methyladenine glycosylase
LVEPTLYLDCPEFDADVRLVARDLIGRTLVVADGTWECRAVIVETEAYGGADDPASHASFRPGGRAAAMSGPAGIIYVYAAYGMYPCLNIVTSGVGVSAAVLVRGVWVEGENRPTLGPGRTTRALGVTLSDHGESACGARFRITRSRVETAIVETPRIGVTRGVELPWRFLSGNISGYRLR